MRTAMTLILMLLVTLGSPRLLQAQDDVADVPSQLVRLNGNRQYFLIGAPDRAHAKEKVHALLVVLPGGDGSADFNPFVRRIYKNSLPDGFLVAQLVAVASDNPNQVVWPTGKNPDPKQNFPTEQFIADVVKDVAARHAIDPERVYALGWSSGGPAVYASLLSRDSPLRGAFVAMSVFAPGRLPPLDGANGKRLFLYQSPDDQVTRYHFAKMAKEKLEAAGAAVELQDYPGGHGWRGNVFGDIRTGIGFLEER